MLLLFTSKFVFQSSSLAVSADNIKIQFTPSSPDGEDKAWSFRPKGARDENNSTENPEQCVCHKSAEQRHSYSNNSLEGDDVTPDTHFNVEVTVHPSDTSHNTKDVSNHSVPNSDDKRATLSSAKVNSKKICSTDIDSVTDDFVFNHFNHSSQHRSEESSTDHSLGIIKHHSSKRTSNVQLNRVEMIKEESLENGDEDQVDSDNIKDKKPLEKTTSDSTGRHQESLLMRRLRNRVSQKEVKDDKEENNNDEDNTDGPSQRHEIINRWRLVLNVQKFESAIRNPQARTADTVPASVILPELKTPSTPGLSNRIVSISRCTSDNQILEFRNLLVLFSRIRESHMLWSSKVL